MGTGRKIDSIDTFFGIGNTAAGLQHIIPCPVIGRIGDTRFVKDILAEKNHLAERASIGQGPYMDFAAGSPAPDHRPDFRMYAEFHLFGRHGGQVSVRGKIQRIQESFLDIRIGLAEVDVHHVRRHIAGDRQEGPFHPFNPDSGSAVEPDLHTVPVVMAVSLRMCLIDLLPSCLENRREAADELLHGSSVRPGGGVGASRVGQPEDLHVDHCLVGKVLDPPRAEPVDEQQQDDARTKEPASAAAGGTCCAGSVALPISDHADSLCRSRTHGS